ncbi:MAG: glycosyltransferase family 9 protein [Zavarzinia sp.]|nr:glycosyltransferase family 9 protein [Zavarzinia sp.]
MEKAIVLIGSAGVEADIAAARGLEVARAIRGAASTVDVSVLRTAHVSAADLAAAATDAIFVITTSPAEIVELYALKAKVAWDMTFFDAPRIEALLGDESQVALLRRALATTQGFTAVAPAVADKIETHFRLGVTSQDIGRIIRYMDNQTAIVLGEGLGNMVYVTSAIRWISERLEAPVDLIIHNRMGPGIDLFAGAPWLNAVYLGYDFLPGRHYRTLVSTTTAGSMPPPFGADRSVWLNRTMHYNEEGRFIHETELNFLGLDGLFGEGPALPTSPPNLFIRDCRYTPPGDRVVGIASGAKPGPWAKREWPHMVELTAALKAAGWKVRSFGLEEEYVEGAEDYCGLSVRDTIYAMTACDYFISYDGGMCHIAEGIGIPTLWIFGPTGSVKNGRFYDHSRTLMSGRSCGPCLYRLDWLRCAQPACMEDVSVASVVEELAKLDTELARDGYAPKRAAPDEALLVYEIDGVHRPPPQAERARYLDERFSAFPAHTLFFRRHIVTLLATGDIAGACEAATGAFARWPQDKGLGFLLAITDAVYKAPTPFDEMADGTRPRAAGITLDDMEVAVELLGTTGFDARDRRFVIEAGARYWLRNGGIGAAQRFLRIVLMSPTLAVGLAKIIERHIERLAKASTDTSAPDPGLGIVFESDKSLSRMTAILERNGGELLLASADKFAKDIEAETDEILTAGFAPYLRKIDNSRHFNVRLNFGRAALDIPHFGAVLILVPHVKYMGSLVGCFSKVLLRHCAGLHSIGLRPFVVTVGYDDVTDGVIFRDSITYIQAHARWQPEQWQEVWEQLKPEACLSYAGVDEALLLPEEARADIKRISVDGLFDCDGLINAFNPENRWDSNPTPWFGENAPDASADDLTAFLAQQPPPLGKTVGGALQTVVLLNDAADFAPLRRLVAVLPSVRFRIYSAFISRDIERNTEWCHPDSFSNDSAQNAHLLIQFSSRQVNLCAEALSWIENGKMVVAPTTLADEGIYGPACQGVEDPAKITSWVDAIRAAERELARSRSTIAYGIERIL